MSVTVCIFYCLLALRFMRLLSPNASAEAFYVEKYWGEILLL